VYFWNVERLRADLRERPVPPVEVVRYAAAILVTWGATSFMPVADTEFRVGDGILLALTVLVTVVGLWTAYRANGGPHGIDLAGRFLALGWVIGLRLMVLCLALLVIMVVIVLVLAFRGQELSDRSIELSAWTMVLVVEIVFYWRLTHHLALVRGAA
jgi:multisubunit Na+/H+ antiporter MnhF subunit